MRSSFNPSFYPISVDIRKPSPESTQPEEPTFHIGEMVMYPSEGVCTIEEVKPMDFSNYACLYYVLKPAAEKSSSTVYLPVNCGNQTLRRLLTRDMVLNLIREAAKHESLWIFDSKQRKEAFTRILIEGDHVKMIKLIQELHEYRRAREQEGKKSCTSDEHILAEAEKRLHQEFAHVLGMNLEETVAFIQQNLRV